MSANQSSGDLFNGIKAVWGQVAALAPFAGPFRDEAPPGTPSKPYVIFSQVGDAEMRIRSAIREYWVHEIEFEVFDDQATKVDAGQGIIGAALDSVLNTQLNTYMLGVGSGGVVYARRRYESTAHEDLRIRSATLQYEIMRWKLRQDASSNL